MPGANLSRASDYNYRLVLDRIRRSRDGISRTEITESTSLTTQTVSNQVSRLIAQGLVVEGERQRQPMGKPRTPLTVERDAGYAVGMHIDPARVSFVVVDLRVNLVRKASFPMPGTVEDLVVLAKEYVGNATASLPAERVLGIGIAAPGVIDIDNGEVIAPHQMLGNERVPLRDLVAEATGLDTFMQKDSIAALTGELWFRDESRQGGAIFVYIGYGVGFAAASRGEICLGGSGNAGELGHLSTGNKGPKCFCGKVDCLGAALDPVNLVSAAVAAGVLDGPVPTSAPEVAEAITRLLQLANRGNEQAVAVVKPVGEALALGLVNLVDLFDASMVIVGGHNAAHLWPFVEPSFKSRYEQFGVARALHGVETAMSNFDEWVAAAGAASVVLDNAFSPSASQVFSQGWHPKRRGSSEPPRAE